MNIIAAVDSNWAIGNKGELLIRIPADMKLFQNPLTATFIIALFIMMVGTYFTVTEKHKHQHTHEALAHEHRHNHEDGHHDHPHDYPVTEHSHPHQHQEQLHDHPHTPDTHHVHPH
jgi:dihydrofolate reductase